MNLLLLFSISWQGKVGKVMELGGFTRTMEEMITSNNQTQTQQQQHQQQHQQEHQQQELDVNSQRKARPQKDQVVNCPRCNSTNTKFCYYNNYSLTQPRYFCKTCRRYWTQGGSLRNVPVGGGSRKNKRSNPASSSTSPSGSTSKLIPDLNPTTNFLIPPHNSIHHQNPSYKIHNHGQDLNLAFPTSTMLQSMEFPKIESSGDLADRSTRSPNNITNHASTSSALSSMEFMRAPGICSSGLGSSYVQVPNALYSSSASSPGFLNLHEMKPTLMGASFNIGSLEEGSDHHANSGGVARLLFPFGDLNKFSTQNNGATNTTRSEHHQVDSRQSIKVSSQDDHHQEQQQHHHQGESGYWNGMLGGGTW